MSHKSAKIAALIENCRGQDLPAHYLGYFECFNRGLFYEAHDVLEELWLPVRREPEGNFFKGLIQLAGAFVHLQKNRLRPAGALFTLARANLHPYGPAHQHLDLRATVQLIDHWHGLLQAGDFAHNPLTADNHPRLELSPR